MKRWRIPLGLVVVGTVTCIVISRLPPWYSQVRQFYVLGLTPIDVYYLLWFVGPLIILVGLGVGTKKLASNPRTEAGGVVVGILTFIGVAIFCWFGYVNLVFSGLNERTEIALDDGRSIVVNASSWRHCDVYLHQRDGIYADIPLGSTHDELPCGAFEYGDYTVEQNGDRVTLSAGGESLMVILQK